MFEKGIQMLMDCLCDIFLSLPLQEYLFGQFVLRSGPPFRKCIEVKCFPRKVGPIVCANSLLSIRDNVLNHIGLTNLNIAHCQTRKRRFFNERFTIIPAELRLHVGYTFLRLALKQTLIMHSNFCNSVDVITMDNT